MWNLIMAFLFLQILWTFDPYIELSLYEEFVGFAHKKLR